LPSKDVDLIIDEFGDDDFLIDYNKFLKEVLKLGKKMDMKVEITLLKKH